MHLRAYVALQLIALATGCAHRSAARNGARIDEMAVSNIAQEVVRDSASDWLADFCQDFHLSADQVRAFVTNAREVSVLEFHDQIWLPCLVHADLAWPSGSARLTISASFVGSLAHSDGRIVRLVCDESCEGPLHYDWSK